MLMNKIQCPSVNKMWHSCTKQILCKSHDISTWLTGVLQLLVDTCVNMSTEIARDHSGYT